MRKEIKKPRLLASGDIKKRFGLSYQFIEELVNSGKLQFWQTSGGRIFREEDVLAFQKEREKKAKQDKRIQLKK